MVFFGSVIIKDSVCSTGRINIMFCNVFSVFLICVYRKKLQGCTAVYRFGIKECIINQCDIFAVGLVQTDQIASFFVGTVQSVSADDKTKIRIRILIFLIII